MENAEVTITAPTSADIKAGSRVRLDNRLATVIGTVRALEYDRDSEGNLILDSVKLEGLLSTYSLVNAKHTEVNEYRFAVHLVG